MSGRLLMMSGGETVGGNLVHKERWRDRLHGRVSGLVDAEGEHLRAGSVRKALPSSLSLSKPHFVQCHPEVALLQWLARPTKLMLVSAAFSPSESTDADDD